MKKIKEVFNAVKLLRDMNLTEENLQKIKNHWDELEKRNTDLSNIKPKINILNKSSLPSKKPIVQIGDKFINFECFIYAYIQEFNSGSKRLYIYLKDSNSIFFDTEDSKENYEKALSVIKGFTDINFNEVDFKQFHIERKEKNEK